MEMSINIILLLSGIGLFGLFLGWLGSSIIARTGVGKAREQAKEILNEAAKDADRKKQKIVLQAKEDWFRKRDEQESRLKGRQRKFDQMERELLEKEKKFVKKENEYSQKESNFKFREREIVEQKEAIRTKDEEYNRIIAEQNQMLSKISQFSIEAAKNLLLQNLKHEYKAEAAQFYKDFLDKAKENATREAKKIITMAIEKNAADHCVETTVSVVHLPSEDLKGRIIGRDGRNIKAFEQATGVKVIVDDTPEAVVLSAFDPVRREVARLALEKIIGNNRIHPQKIEEIVRSAEKEVDKTIWRCGNEVIARIGVGRLHPDLIRILGRLRFRSSYGQNVLQHCEEVSTLTGAMAAELNLDIKLAKRAGLLHDIGKAMSQEQEGTHVQIGLEIGRKFKENPVVMNAIASHHEDSPKTTLISVLVACADSISGARPGARRDSIDGYIRRIESLEKVADSFELVKKAYAISAGREVRVIVQPDKVSDAQADLLANEIAAKIQTELEYPGQIKITVIRETKAVSYA